MSETIFAIVENDVIKNVVVADPDYDNPSAINITNIEPRPGRGWKLVDGAFVDPTQDVVADPPPTNTPTRYSPQEFLSLLTIEERAGIFSSQNTVIVDFLNMLQYMTLVSLVDPLVTGFMTTLVSEGIITQARHDEIMP